METPDLMPTAETTILFVHAHPDDETIVTGATMAAWAAAGARVVLVTCTRGELGEVIPAELGHLEVDQSVFAQDSTVRDNPAEGGPDAGTNLSGDAAPGAGLAKVRELELAQALSALGVHEHIWLGQGVTSPDSGPVEFRDSGMKWGPDGRATGADIEMPDSLSRAPLVETAELLARAVRELRPDMVVTYAADGGYGHPDHARTHLLTLAALRLASGAGPAGVGPDGTAAVVTGWKVPAVYAIVSDRPERPLEDGVPRIAVKGDLAAKTAAMAAHRTQITVDGQRFALSDNVWREISATEEFVAIDAAQIYAAE